MSQNGTNDSKAPKLGPLKPPHRRLVVMFDGTGNTRESLTNVARMFEAIDDSHPDSYKRIGSSAEDWPSFHGPASTKIVPCGTCNQSMEPAKHEGDDSKAYFRAGVPCSSCHQLVVEPELQPVQLVRYITGVGTNYTKFLSRLTAQMIGYGLSDKIKEGYTWLCENYQEDDEVFVFGFSRGAFAARSLVSLLYKCDGVLKIPSESRDHTKVIETAYKYYGECVKDGINEAHHKLGFDKYLREHKNTIQRLHVQVKMLGVWDTVGALGLGIPKTGRSIIDNSRLSGTHYEQFHEQGLSCIVENAYHALALDEHRKHFKPTLWTSQDPLNQEVKQVWFAGSHCNVGGGADLDDTTDPDDLWQYSYVWMQRQAEKHGLRFFWSYESSATRQANSHLRTRRLSLREPEHSYENFVWGFYSKFFGKSIRKTDPNLAMLHWSVLERIKAGEASWVKVEENLDPELDLVWSVLLKIRVIFLNIFNFFYFWSTSEGVSSPRPKATRHLVPKSLVGIRTYAHYAKFRATVIPEGSTEAIAPHQVDGKWHIETDDVRPCTQWGLPVRPTTTEEKKGKEKEVKKVE